MAKRTRGRRFPPWLVNTITLMVLVLSIGAVNYFLASHPSADDAWRATLSMIGVAIATAIKSILDHMTKSPPPEESDIPSDTGDK